MNPYHPGALAAICALCLLAAAVIGGRNGFYRGQLAAEGGRFESIDGLRGFLALGVFGEHAMSMHGLLTSGTWAAGVAPFFLQASRAGVAMFFMITAFLFSLRVLRSGDSFGARAFFISRIRRLTPMYAFSVLMALAVVFSASGLALRVPLPELLRELRPWLSFGFMTTGPLNGVADAHAINAVYWTLAYEWMFYLALPLLALFARGPWSALPLLAVLYFGAEASMVYNFLFGALAALFVHRRVLEPRLFLKSWLVPLPLAALAAYFALAAGEHRLAESALLFVFFLFVVHGYDALGLLHTRPAKLLGMVSYSLYLTHCIVLYVVMHAADRMVAIASLSAVQYWLLAALAALGAVAVSCLTYRYVEFPFIHPQPQSNTNRRDSWTRRLISGW
jgi:peptidoglycan/LPS O-acetylase OafA/YrhL